MGKKIDIPRDNNIVRIPIEEAMPDNYLPYAVEVAKDRALPDVRDGLKPVHRRILYGAYVLNAFPTKPYYKSARIVGDILGKFHPHGDASVYDAMVILAQGFATRLPLIDGHGNWGSQDGDSAAAMRYTEARLTKAALEMIRDIDKGVVDMVENYSNSELEPKVLPARYPNLLVNGTFGIAVGLATNIPPHNLGEVIDATLAYIDNPEVDTAGLMNYIKGPDLPTGGVIIGKNALLAAYESGEGKVTLRAKTSIEKLENGRIGIVIHEFPYRRNKAKILQIISEMTADKKHAKALEAISDIRDESDRTGIRAVIELKKSVTEDGAEKILKYLYKKTDLQCNLPFNMVALANGKPETMGLKTILIHYVNHQKEVITRRTQRELQVAEKRFHIVEGFIKAIDIIDEIITVIRASKSKKDSEQNLQQKFGFTEMQSEAIVELMLYRLTGLEIKTFEKEHKELEKQIKALKKILSSELELLKVIKREMLEIKEKFNDPRRTELIENDNEAKIDLEELIVVEDIMITMSNEGYIKRIPLKVYNRSSANVEEIEYREGDYNRFLIFSNTKDTILFFTDKGNVYQIKGVSVPEFKWKEKGEKIETLIKGLDLESERIVSTVSISSFASQRDFIFFTSRGMIKKTELERFNTSYTKLLALKLKEEEKLIDVQFVENNREEKFIQILTKEGLRFSLVEPSIAPADRNILGASLFSLPKTDEVVEVQYTDQYEYKEFGIVVNGKGIIKVLENKRRIGENEVYCITNSTSSILFFTDDGLVSSIPAFMLANIGEKGFPLRNLIHRADPEKVKVLTILSVQDFNEKKDIYFFSMTGMIKRTQLSEFEGNYEETVAYKLKNEQDKLVNVVSVSSRANWDAMIFTRKAMCIRFESGTVNYMGRIASGVTGISLKEEDEVIFGTLVPSESNEGTAGSEIAIDYEKKETILLISRKKFEEKILLDKIKMQNRAGRGSNVMFIIMDDTLEKVKMLK